MTGYRSAWITASLLLMLFAATPAGVFADRVNWKDIEEGEKQAEASGKKLMLYFRTSWCGYCDRMEGTTFDDESVAAFLKERFVPVKVNADKQQRLAAAYRIQSYPTSWFLTPEGEKILFLPGYAPAEPFLQVLRFIDTDAYLDMSFEEYLEANE